VHLRSPFAVLFVCTGNICRSPLGERLLEAKLPQQAFEVASAGVMAMVGQGMDPDAAAQLQRRGGDPTGFRAHQISERLLRAADLILVATLAHRQRILEELPSALNKTFTILEFADLVQSAQGETPGALVAYAARHRSTSTLDELDVPDPYRGGEAAHAEAAQLISDAVDRIAEALMAVSG